MWRQNSFHKNADSDPSISDEEELDDVFLGNSAPLHASASKKEELPLPLRLDFLRVEGFALSELQEKANATLFVDRKTQLCINKQSLEGMGIDSSFKKSAASPQEEEVEMPDFEEGNLSHLSGEAVANSSDEDIIYEDRGTAGLSKFVISSSTRVLHKYGSHVTRSGHIRNADEEFESVSLVNELTSCSANHAAHSKAKKASDGIWRKAKPQCSQQSLSHKVVPFGPSVSNCDSSVLFKMHRLPEPLELAAGTMRNSTPNFPEDDEGIENLSDIEPDEVKIFSHGANQNPETDFFDNLKDKTMLLSRNSRKHRRRREKRVHLFSRRSTSHLQEMIADSEDSVEPMDSGTSSENEVSDQNMNTTLVEKKMQTMADQFQEALGASLVNDEGDIAAPIPLRAGIFGNLQRVVQREKERDINFWKELQTGARPDSELGCFTVKIISRYLDAKLTVCHCLCDKTKNFPLLDNSKGIVSGGGQQIIIFSPRVCNNVDLEVGNSIRIHPPWKEVQVGKDNAIILCTYFSQIS